MMDHALPLPPILPVEMLEKIFSYLSSKRDMKNVSYTCKLFYQIIRPVLWREPKIAHSKCWHLMHLDEDKHVIRSESLRRLLHWTFPSRYSSYRNFRFLRRRLSKRLSTSYLHDSSCPRSSLMNSSTNLTYSMNLPADSLQQRN